MAKKTYRGVSRRRLLKKSEAAKYRRIRQQVEQELPPAKPDPVKVATAKRRAIRESQ